MMHGDLFLRGLLPDFGIVSYEFMLNVIHKMYSLPDYYKKNSISPVNY